MALECMRGAARQGRPCYLYAFSGPQQCQELLLDHSPGSMAQLLDFLSHSFLGGTDVDTPFLRSLDRLTQDAWHLADILLVRWQLLHAALWLLVQLSLQHTPNPAAASPKQSDRLVQDARDAANILLVCTLTAAVCTAPSAALVELVF